MRYFVLFCIIIVSAYKLQAQDKLFFTNGSTKTGMIVSNVKDFIYFKQTDSSATEKISKSDLILVEDYKGTRYIYGKSDTEIQKELKPATQQESGKNMLTLQPLGALFGRISLQYERLTKDNKFGIVIPFALTFNPFGTIYPASTDSNYTEPTGISFITGLDINYYVGRRENFQFFIGPRIRYGTDMMLGEIEGYSIQTQFGWKVGKPSARFVQHISFGFGFLRVISVAAAQTVDPKQSYAWGSINYRFGIRW